MDDKVEITKAELRALNYLILLERASATIEYATQVLGLRLSDRENILLDDYDSRYILLDDGSWEFIEKDQWEDNND